MKAYFVKGSFGNDFVFLASDPTEAMIKAHRASGCDCQDNEELEFWEIDEITEIPQRVN